MTAFHIVFRRFARILFLAASAMPLPALAQTTLWNTLAGGDWTDATKWTNGVPGSNYTVGFQNFIFKGTGGGAVTTEITYDYSGPNITLNSLSIPGNSHQIGQITQDGNRLATLSENVGGVYQLTGAGI